jgi:hypothetical protein
MPPSIPPVVAHVLSVLGVAVAALAPVLPANLQAPVAIVAMTLASLGGGALTPPALTAGSPKLQGALLTFAGTVLGVLTQFYAMIPAGLFQSLALTAVALLCYLTGRAMPALGSPSHDQLAAATAAGASASAAVTDKASAVAELKGGA